VQSGEHFPNRLQETDFNRATDQKMTDIKLLNQGAFCRPLRIAIERRNRTYIFRIETMARMGLHSELAGEAGGFLDAFELLPAGCFFPRLFRKTVTPRVELDCGRS
jgi:hypothetical protein